MDSKELRQLIADLRSSARYYNTVYQHTWTVELLNKAADTLEHFLRALDQFDVNG